MPGMTNWEVINVAVWVKSNAGQGSFYRSQHEFIGVFRVGKTPHLNNVDLGRHGRSVGRHARALEIEPRFVDVAIRRWQAFTGRDAFHAESGLRFDEIEAASARSGPNRAPK